MSYQLKQDKITTNVAVHIYIISVANNLHL